METLLRILRRGRRAGEFDTGPPVQWQVSAITALGHAATGETAAGRMSMTAAGSALRDAALRIAARTAAGP